MFPSIRLAASSSLLALSLGIALEPAAVQAAEPDPGSLREWAARLAAMGCPSPPGQNSPSLSRLQRQIDACLAGTKLSPEARSQLHALRLDIASLTPADDSSMGRKEINAILTSLQQQIDTLRSQVAKLEAEKIEGDERYAQREKELELTIANLRSEVQTLKTERTLTAEAGKPVEAGESAETPGAPAEEAPPAEPPKFAPTLRIGGTVNLVVGGVDGPSDAYTSDQWRRRTIDSNRDFANAAVQSSPRNVTGATNKADGRAFAYYRTGQSQEFFPPNGLRSVDRDVARSYSITSSWTGGKVKFDSLARGGNLVITDPKDPNYDEQNPRTLDREGYQLTVNLRGQPVLPNSGLGGLKDPRPDFTPVEANDFQLNNLGSDITFANIPLGQKDIRNLINLGNASRREKLGNRASSTQEYITRAGESISTIAFQNGTSAANLLELNPQLPPSTAANAVLRQGTTLNIPVVGCVYLCKGLNTVANGGLVNNTAQYDDLLNLAIAEYGSLTEKQRENKEIKKLAQKFVRDLVGTSRGDVPEIEDFNFQRSWTFNNDVKLNFTGSVSGKDLLFISLRYRNIEPYGERSGFPATNLAYGFGSIDNNYVTFDRLWWKIPIFNDSSFWIGTRLKDYNFLPLQYGTFYPVEQQNYFFASGAGLADYVGAGAGVTLTNVVKNFLGGNLSVGFGYLANPFDAIDPVSNSFEQKGIFGRDTRFRLPVQIGYLSEDNKIMASINYVYSRGDTLNAFVGTTRSANPFFYDIDAVNQLGFTFAWEFTDNVSINAVYNHFHYTARYDADVFGVPMVSAGDTAKARSWMTALLVDDLFSEGSTLGLAVGQVPAIYENSSAWGTDSSPIALEAWYDYQLSDRITMQPGIFFVTDHDGNADGGTDWGATMRVYLNF
jgi:LysM repeat protein